MSSGPGVVTAPQATVEAARRDRERLFGAADETSGEVYLKSSRLRTFRLDAGFASVHHSEEAGWAVRARRGKDAGFACGTGRPHMPLLARSDCAPCPPRADVDGPFQEPEGLDESLLSEGEGIAVLRAIEDRLRDELSGARLLGGRLDDGGSQAAIASSEGIECESRLRVATLRLRAVGPDALAGEVALAAASRGARALAVQAFARRLVDRMVIAERGVSGVAEKTAAVLSPEVATALLESLVPLFLGTGNWPLLQRMATDGRFACRGLDLVDDGRGPVGLMPSAVDGEGVPTGRVALVEDGELRQPLLSWLDEPTGAGVVVGCRHRPSYRNLPATAPSHLYVAARTRAAVGDLIDELGGGFYLLDVLGPVRRHFEEGWLEVPVCGFQIRGGKARAPVNGVRLHVEIGAFLRSVRGVGSDLRFRPRHGCIGSPSLLVGDCQLLPAPSGPSVAKAGV